MSLTGSDAGGDFELMKPSNYVARCVMVIDLGIQENSWKGETSLVHQIMLGFEFATELRTEGDDAGTPFLITNRYRLSLGKKANLRRDIESWRGKPLTATELEGFDFTKVAGAPAMIQVINKTTDDKTRAKISTIAALPKGTACLAAVNPIVVYDTSDGESEVYKNLPEWIRKIINIPAAELPPAASAPETASTGEVDDFDDDVPF